jgi:small-conductance mechanosensitive channel
METQIPTLSELLLRQGIFLHRPEVQHQWAAIFSSLIASWFLSKFFWHWLQYKFPHFTIFFLGDKQLSWREYRAFLIQSLDFPLLGLGLLGLNRLLFYSQGLTDGLIIRAFRLMIVYVAYRGVLMVLYNLFPVRIIRTYQSRLFTPLIVLFFVGSMATLNDNLESLFQISLFKIFGSVVTIGSLIGLITGFYFWIIIVVILEEITLSVLDSKAELERGKIEATLLLLRYFLISLGIVIILGAVGVNGNAVAAITGGLSVGIGFGLQQVVSNFVSGILLLFEGVLRPGDMVSVDGDICRVTKLGIRATTVVRTLDNSEKIIPNQKFFTSDLTTYTGSDRLIYCSVLIGVGYESKSAEVTQLLLAIAENHPQILADPAPLAFFLDFGDSCLNFELKFWLDDVNTKKRIVSDLNCAILETFREHQISIPFPQRDLHLYDHDSPDVTATH